MNQIYIMHNDNDNWDFTVQAGKWGHALKFLGLFIDIWEMLAIIDVFSD